MHKIKQTVTSVFLLICMLTCLAPFTAFAEDEVYENMSEYLMVIREEKTYKKITITSNEAPIVMGNSPMDASEIADFGYICFELYVDPKVKNVGMLRVRFNSSITTPYGNWYSSSDVTVPDTASWQAGEWNKAVIPLSEFRRVSTNDAYDFRYPTWFSFRSLGGLAGTNIKVRNLGFYAPKAPMLNKLDGKEGKVALKWNGSMLEGTAGYRVIRDGETVAELPADVYEYTDDPEDNAFYTYSLQTVDADGNVLAETASQEVTVYSRGTTALGSWYGTTKNDQFLAFTGSATQYEDRQASSDDFPFIPEGTYAAHIKASIVSKQPIRTAINNVFHNLDSIKNTGVIRFRMYINAQGGKDVKLPTLSMCLANSGNTDSPWASTNAAELDPKYTDASKIGKWQIVTVPISEMTPTEKGFDYSKVWDLRWIPSESASWSIYVQNVEYCSVLQNPKLTQKAIYMNDDGMLCTELAVSEKLNTNTLSVDQFRLSDGVECSDLSYTENGDDRTLTLLFDAMPAFPSEMELYIGEGIMSADEMEMKQTELKLSFPAAQSRVKVTVTQEPQLKDGEAAAAATVKGLYVPEGSDSRVQLLMPVYSGGYIIACGRAITDSRVLRKDTAVLTVTAEIPEEYRDAENLTAEMWFIDSGGTGIPFADRTKFNLKKIN